MHVRVVLEVLTPGVQDGQEPDLGPEVLGVGGDLLQGLGGGAEQEPVDLPRVLHGDRAQRRGEREDHVMVLDRQELRGARSIHCAAAVAWHLGQWRLRHELYAICRWPHRSHSSTCPPRAAVRHSAMSRSARRCPGERTAAKASRKAGP